MDRDMLKPDGFLNIIPYLCSDREIILIRLNGAPNTSH